MFSGVAACRASHSLFLHFRVFPLHFTAIWILSKLKSVI
jgi:hypothetical protein